MITGVYQPRDVSGKYPILVATGPQISVVSNGKCSTLDVADERFLLVVDLIIEFLTKSTLK